MTQTPIYIKLGYREALDSKRNILSSQRDLLNLTKTMKNYQFLRLEELKIKTRLHRRIKETLTEIRKIQKFSPKPKIPNILKNKDGEEFEFEQKIKKTNQFKYDSDLESQLEEIQEKLRNLS